MRIATPAHREPRPAAFGGYCGLHNSLCSGTIALMRVSAFEIAEPVPELHDTCAVVMLRPWVDVGRVGTLALTQLEKHTDAKELGRLARPGVFYDFTRYRPRTRTVDGQRILSIPNTVVHWAKDKGTERDYLFVHLREPHAMSEDFSDAFVTLLEHFGVTDYCRIGGFYDSVPHTRPLLVTATVSEAQAERAKGLISPRKNTYQGPTSVVNLVNEGLEASDTQTTSLMVHLPQYVQLDRDHYGAFRLLEPLCAIYGFPASLADSDRGEQQYREISRAVGNSPEVRGVIQQLESEYDRLQSSQEPEEPLSISPDVDKFLREMSKRLEDGGEGE